MKIINKQLLLFLSIVLLSSCTVFNDDALPNQEISKYPERVGVINKKITATTDIAHGLKSEDLVTLVSPAANKEMEGSYIITVPEGSTTTFTFKSVNENNLADAYFVFKDAIEIFESVRNGDVAITKIRAGSEVWDTGNSSKEGYWPR